MKSPTIAAWLISLILAATVAAQTSAPAKVSYIIHTDQVVSTIDKGIYGQFLEHIYNSVHGGIWGDQILNGTFELRPPRAGRGATQPANSGVAAPLYWEFAGDRQLIQNDATDPINGSGSIRIQRSDAGPIAGIAQKNIALQAGENYQVALYLKGRGKVHVEFTDEKGSVAAQDFSALTNSWKRYEFVGTPSRTTTSATLTIGSRESGDISIDQVSMFSESAWATGGFRPDLLQAITDLKPTSIRWPGGSYANRYVWESGVGPREKRVPHPVEIWNDRDPNQFGTDEFMQLCAKIGAEPVIVLNTARGVQANLNWLEYCMGDEKTTLGAMRIQNGHKEPYPLKTIEIDNETWLLMDKPAYVKIVRDFAPAIRAKYPNLKLSVCGSYAYDDGPGEGRPENAGWDQTMLDEVAKDFDILSPHYYNGLLAQHPPDYVNDPRRYEQHLVGIGERIKKSANPNIKLYVSEWNLTHGAWGNDWRVGLYAGGILNALERQSNLVIMSCPALWMRRTWATAWNNALINFDQSRWFPAGNYVVMKLFRDSYAPKLLTVDGPQRPLNLTATRAENGDTVYLKLVNPEKTPVDAEFTLDGSFTASSASMQLVAPGEETAKNSLDHPDVIKPVAAPVQREGNKIRVSLPPLSVGVVSVVK